MPAILKLINFDELFNNSKGHKFIVNEMDIFNQANKKVIDRYIFANYEEDSVSIIPSCECGNIKGTYYIGELCPFCNTYVKSLTEDNINFLLWAKRPEGVEKFISPIILEIIKERYKLSKPTIYMIKYLLLPHYKFDKRQYKNKLNEFEKLTSIFEHYNIKRGYNNFIENLLTIVEILENHFAKKNIIEVDFVSFMEKNIDKILSEYLPFPNKIIFNIESNEHGRYLDKSILPCVNTIRRLSGIDLHFKPSTVKQNKVANSLIELGEFYKQYTKETFFAKKGLIRQHISSTRSHFTMRCVAVSISDPHRYDEVYLPWSASVTLFQQFLINKLIKRNFIYKDAIMFLNNHNRIYSPLLEELFKEIIADSGGGIDMLINRNPSLHRGSIIHVKATKIKTDTNDNTISCSLMLCRSLNLDFDGDEVSLSLLLLDKNIKNDEESNLSNFDLHLNLLSLSEPNKFSNIINYPKTIVNLISNWYEKDY